MVATEIAESQRSTQSRVKSPKTGATTRAQVRNVVLGFFLIGSRGQGYQSEPKRTTKGYNRSTESTLRPGIFKRHFGKAAITQFGI